MCGSYPRTIVREVLLYYGSITAIGYALGYKIIVKGWLCILSIYIEARRVKIILKVSIAYVLRNLSIYAAR